MTAPVPILTPRLPPPAPGAECCGCCAGIEPETPRAVFNRGGLSAIAYRIGQHGHFRASLHAALSSAAFGPLGRLRARDDADFTIGLMDAFACSADVLTFYQERIASESWLRTATERLSLQELGKLVGYRLRPGLAAETWLAFALDPAPAPPPGAPDDPGSFVTGVPDQLRLDAGLKVQSVPGPDEKPQSFELVESLAEARAAWNVLRPWLAETHAPTRGDRETWFDGVATGLRQGDALLFVGPEFQTDPSSDRWDFRIAASVDPDPARARTRVTWTRGLGSLQPRSDPSARPAVYALRKRSGVFGQNAPVWRSMNTSFRIDYASMSGASYIQPDWPGFTISTVAATDATGGAVDLDAQQPDIAVDAPEDPARRSFAVLAKGGYNRPDEAFPPDTYVELYRVTGASEVSRAAFAMAAKVTRLTLAGENLATIFSGKVRETSVFARSDLLPLAPHPVVTPVAGDRIPVAVAAAGLLPGRRLIVRGARVADGAAVTLQATLIAAHRVDANRCVLEVTPPLADPLRRDSVLVHANVAVAGHGETVAEILGSGSAARSFQRFELRHRPISHRAAETELGAAAELTVRVGEVAWRERPTLFGARPIDHVYALTTDAAGRTFAVFGDGARGARLPSGGANVRASYRKGLGAEGNVRAESLTQLMTRPLGLKGVSNPLAAEGGADPEPPDEARQTIPLTTRTLGRAVSLLDYEDFARAYSGVAKARAAVLQLDAGPTIAVTIAAPRGKPMTTASPVWTRLLAALRASGDPHVAVALLPHAPATFHIGLRVKRDPDFDAGAVLAAVEAALRERFGFDARRLGQAVQQSEVVAVAQAAPGVVAVDLTRLWGGSSPTAQAAPSLQVRLLAARMRILNGVPLPDEILTLDPGPLDLLEEMA